MSKLEESYTVQDYIDMFNAGVDIDYYNRKDVKELVCTYAEYYAKKCLSIAADNAKTVRCPNYDKVNKESITNIQLPNHE